MVGTEDRERSRMEKAPLLSGRNSDSDLLPSKYGDNEFVESLVSVKEAILHGIHPTRIVQGSSGSYFMHNTKAETVAVFKPKDEEPYGHLNPKWTKWLHKTICPLCFGRSCLVPNQGYLSEAGASLIDCKLGLDMVPRTKVVHLASPVFNYDRHVRWYYHLKHKLLPSKVGSFQLFKKGYTDGQLMLHKFDETTNPELNRLFGVEFEKLVVLDYVIRNTDRGNDNWLVKIEDPSDETVQPPAKSLKVHIAAIDNGLAFPFKHPDSWRAYPYYWAWLPQAKIPFSDRIAEKLLPLLTDEGFVDEIIEELHGLFSQDRGFSNSLYARQASVLRGQIVNLSKALRDKLSPWELIHMPVCTIGRNGTLKYQAPRLKMGFNDPSMDGDREDLNTEEVLVPPDQPTLSSVEAIVLSDQNDLEVPNCSLMVRRAQSSNSVSSLQSVLMPAQRPPRSHHRKVSWAPELQSSSLDAETNFEDFIDGARKALVKQRARQLSYHYKMWSPNHQANERFNRYYSDDTSIDTRTTEFK
eukprot:Ihof_evm3s44 gene=Ihof_evmTU3s44